MKFDDIFTHIGEFGRYQIGLVCAVFLMNGWPNSVYSIVYTAVAIPYWCENTTQPLAADQCVRNVTIDDITVTSKCEKWSFDHTNYGRTIIEKYSMVCDKEWLLSLAHTIYILGMLIGSIVAGIMADRFGRITAFFLFNLHYCIWFFICIFAPSYWLFVICRFMVAIGRMGTFLAGYTYCVEIVGEDWRNFVSISHAICYSLGYVSISGIAYLIQDAVNLELAILVPYQIFLLLYFVLPESPRWLLVNKQHDKAKKVLHQIATYNNKALPQNFDCNQIELLETKNVSTASLQLLLLPHMRKRLFILLFYWFAVVLVYYAFTLNSHNLLPGNMYLNNFLLAAVETPGALIGLLLCSLRPIGRRYSAFLFMILCGVCSFITAPILLYNYGTAATSVAILGKLFLFSSFCVIYLYTAELMPTEIRTSAMGYCSAMGRVGGLFSALVGREMGQVWVAFPYLTFGVLSTLAASLTLLLPETLNTKLSETMMEAEMSSSEYEVMKAT